MADILVVSDAPRVRREVIAALDDDTIREVETGDAVPPAVRERRPDLVITDLQVGSMGGMAISLELRLEESGGRLPHVAVLMLCDRRADVFLARRLMVASEGSRPGLRRVVLQLRLSHAQETGRSWSAAHNSTAAIRHGCS